MATLFRLSRIGNALPTSHLYPHSCDDQAYRTGAQCFRRVEDVVYRGKEVVENWDRLLMIRVPGDVDEYAHDESGWTIITPRDRVEVRVLPMGEDLHCLLREYEDDDELWAAGEPVAVEWTQTLTPDQIAQAV